MSDHPDTADVRLSQFSYQQVMLVLQGAKRVPMDWNQDVPRSVQRPQASPLGTRRVSGKSQFCDFSGMLRWNVVARYPMSVERVVPVAHFL